MNRAVPLVIVVVVAAAIVAVIALSPSAPPKTSTTSTITIQTFHEGQLFATTGIMERGIGLYFLNTSLRSLTQSPVVGIRATVNYSKTVSETNSMFFVGNAQTMSNQVTPLHPLGYNVTANVGTTELSPPTSLQLGALLPEIINVTFQNGTSVALHVPAQVFSAT
jgi:hypothetical protein